MNYAYFLSRFDIFSVAETHSFERLLEWDPAVTFSLFGAELRSVDERSVSFVERILPSMTVDVVPPSFLCALTVNFDQRKLEREGVSVASLSNGNGSFTDLPNKVF